jgi:glutamate-1-semialdehyde 2,1-aminomutase
MTGPGEAMIAFAEAMAAQVSHADWAMFCKNGTDPTSMAVTTARAHSGRGKIWSGVAPTTAPPAARRSAAAAA